MLIGSHNLAEAYEILSKETEKSLWSIDLETFTDIDYFVQIDSKSRPLNRINSHIASLQIATSNGAELYFNFAHKDGDLDYSILPTIFSYCVSKVLIIHNANFEYVLLKLHGMDISGFKIYDTMIMGWMINENLSQSLKQSVARIFQYSMKKYEDTVGDKGHMGNITGEEGYSYGMDDAIWTLKLFYFYYQHPAFSDTYYQIFKQPLIAAIGDHYINGQSINLKVLEELHLEDIKDRQKIISDYQVLQGVNIDSPNQISKLFFETLKLPIVKVSKKTGKPSTDKEVLNSLIEDYAEEYPVIKAFSKLRTIATREKLYYKPYPFLLYPDKLLHSEIRQTGTVTGRFSMSGPNLQQLSKRGEGVKVRRIFTPKEGHDYIVSIDWSQIELRMAAHLSQDPKLLDAYRTDKDLHTVSGTNILSCSFEEIAERLAAGDPEAKKARQKGKTLNFAALYGATAGRLSKFDLLNCSTGEAEVFLQLHKQGYAQYFYNYWEEKLAECRNKTYVTTLFGNRRNIPDILSPIKSIKAEAQNKVVNAIVQGSCSELMSAGFGTLYSNNLLYNDDIHFIAPIHDEFVFSMTKKGLLENIHTIRSIMEEAPKGFTVPIKASVSFGLNFADQVEVGEDLSVIESMFEEVDSYTSKGN